MAVAFVERTVTHFEKATDPRANRGPNDPLIEMGFVALCGAICDCHTWTAVADFGRAKLAWFRKFLPFEPGIPAHDTFTEVFARLDTIEFYAALESWAGEMAGALPGETVAFDGKTLRGSFDAAADKSALHSVSAWACSVKLCLKLQSVAEKSHEVPAVQQLIDLLDLEGAVVTADAMHCQRETAEKILAQEADYVLMVKGNQETLQAAVQAALAQAMEAEDSRLRRCQATAQNRDRREPREVAALPVPRDSAVFRDWPGVKTIGGIDRCREVDGRWKESQAFFSSSLPCRVRALSQHLRSHGSIENSQHDVLDVTFSEDSRRTRHGNGPEITSVFRRRALHILQRDTSLTGSIRRKRKRCGWDEMQLGQLLAGFTAV